MKYLKVVILVIIDAILVNISVLVSMFIRFELSFNELLQYDHYIKNYTKMALLFSVGTIIVFYIMKLYRSLWEYAGAEEALCIIVASGIVNIALMGYILYDPTFLPRSIPVINTLVLSFFVLICRFGYRSLRIFSKRLHKNISAKAKRTMIVGGGAAGATVIREAKTSDKSTNNIVCVIDDDRLKLGSSIHGVKICGDRNDIPRLVEKMGIEEIIIAMPSAKAKDRHEIIEICQRTGCNLRTLPGIYQLVNGEVSIQKIRKVEVDDLLGRDSVKVDFHEISGYVKDKVVLVTGGGGSIGSELCRQISENSPKELIIFDIYENNAYSIQQELRYKHPELNLTVLIGSVRDEDRINAVFEKHKPQIVYHAAAHKHVPLMEDSPAETIKNNIFGTYNTANAAHKNGSETFILISTDKAVNPTNIMGASKRVCEMVVQYFASISDTKFAAVRFGNVLGSNGSVVPLFKKQIERGGPVTVTHPDIIRFFMTIPEAVSLVLQAGAYANNGEIFVLDMGDPVRIDDLARNMIRLSGFEPDVDIKIEYSGLRDGEKLYEELLLSGEGLGKTSNDLIFIGHPQKKDDALFIREMDELRQSFNAGPDEIRILMQRIVPEYHPELGGKK
ncbi:MAG: polysaccharide biosynthesis protein [Ruminococcaceae bacterium]|nr:polysaccharide biosynthesis protein [Oscillospiraceae bacterium]